MRFLILIVFVVLSLSSFTLHSFNSNAKQGMGIDIIQGKQQLFITLTNNNCGESQIFIFDPKGKKIDSSPIFNKTNPHWNLSTNGWRSGAYTIQALALSGYCSQLKTLTIN